MRPPCANNTSIRRIIRAYYRRAFPVLYLAGLTVFLQGQAHGESIAVLYPQLRAPYAEIFNAIINGIEKQSGRPVDLYPLNRSYDITAIDSRIGGKINDVVIALGSRGMEASKQLSSGIPVIIGAVLVSTLQSIDPMPAAISLAPDPEALFAKLKSLAPRIEKISVVYNPENDQLVIDRAAEAAVRQKLLIDAHKASELTAAAQLYKKVLDSIEPKTTAIWLLEDAAINDTDTVLPFILNQAWGREIVVFSSSLAHTRRGALFSMYPDNFKMGMDLGKLAVAVLKDGKKKEISVLKSLKIAVNKRTARHLGISFSRRQAQSLDLVFPRR